MTLSVVGHFFTQPAGIAGASLGGVVTLGSVVAVIVRVARSRLEDRRQEALSRRDVVVRKKAWAQLRIIKSSFDSLAGLSPESEKISQQLYLAIYSGRAFPKIKNGEIREKARVYLKAVEAYQKLDIDHEYEDIFDNVERGLQELSLQLESKL